MWRSFFWLPLIASCAPRDGAQVIAADPCQVITDRGALASCVGKRVTLRGTISRTKSPGILGVDVDAPYALADQLGEATGTLESYTIEPQPPGELVRASKGPGTYYALRDGVGLAKARLAI
ncbi:MAG: hypothetical protein WKG01_21350 [Kofleriaceae bacterium]